MIKDRKMFRNLIGKSSFDIRDMKCSLLMATFIILVFLVAGLYRYNLGEPPCYSFFNDWHYVLLVHSLKSLCADVS